MMYIDLVTPFHVAMLHDWLDQMGRLFVRLELPHSGGSGTSHSIFSLDELKRLILEQTHPEIEIFIFKGGELNEEELVHKLDLRWVYGNADLVLYIGVQKNRNYYEQYENGPQKYKDVVAKWFE